MVLLAAWGGLRWGEIAGLRVGDLDPLSRRVRIERQAVEAPGRGAEVRDVKTAAGRRVVAVPGFVVEALAAAAGEGTPRARHPRRVTRRPACSVLPAEPAPAPGPNRPPPPSVPGFGAVSGTRPLARVEHRQTPGHAPHPRSLPPGMLDQGPPGPLLTDLGQTTTPSASADAFADALPRGDIEEGITSVQARIEQAIAPFASEVALLDTLVGVGPSPPRRSSRSSGRT